MVAAAAQEGELESLWGRMCAGSRWEVLGTGISWLSHGVAVSRVHFRGSSVIPALSVSFQSFFWSGWRVLQVGMDECPASADWGG